MLQPGCRQPRPMQPRLTCPSSLAEPDGGTRPVADRLDRHARRSGRTISFSRRNLDIARPAARASPATAATILRPLPHQPGRQRHRVGLHQQHLPEPPPVLIASPFPELVGRRSTSRRSMQPGDTIPDHPDCQPRARQYLGAGAGRPSPWWRRRTGSSPRCSTISPPTRSPDIPGITQVSSGAADRRRHQPQPAEQCESTITGSRSRRRLADRPTSSAW